MSPVLTLRAQRIALGVLLLFLVSVLIFAGTSILPGDVAQSILGQSATPEALANLRRDLGLNDPPLARYFDWLGAMMTGDLGTALTSGLDITSEIGRRLGNTLFLAFWSPGQEGFRLHVLVPWMAASVLVLKNSRNFLRISSDFMY